ncbi:MAG: hypothetical protein K5891_07695 [Lachnospiraceae bacterium]|nr:hypothetical protein [Lachnospiraceae bacterium]
MNRKKYENFTMLLPAAVLFALLYRTVMQEIANPLSDVNGHVYVYILGFLQDGFLSGWKEVPYCMWHLPVLFLYKVCGVPLANGAGLVSGFFAALGYLVTYDLIRRYAERRNLGVSPLMSALISFSFSLVQGIYVDFWDAGERFSGIFSMNPLHNPTHMAVRPFAMLCFALVVDLWAVTEEGKEGLFFPVERDVKKYRILLTVMLFLSAMAKPVFAEMFVPAVAFTMLVRWIAKCTRKEEGKAYFAECLRMLLCAVPALVYILLQFLAYFMWGGSYGSDGGFTVTSWMEVWSLFSDNVLLSILCGMAFPIYILLLSGKWFLENAMGRLALVGYGIGLLEAALLGEGGVKLSHGDFLWPMMCGMLLWWLAALLRLLELEGLQGATAVTAPKAADETTPARDARAGAAPNLRNALLCGAWLLFLAHVIFGFLYLRTLMG